MGNGEWGMGNEEGKAMSDSKTTDWPETAVNFDRPAPAALPPAAPPYDPYGAVRDGLKGVMSRVEDLYDHVIPLLEAGTMPCLNTVSERLIALHELLGRARIALLPLSGRAA